MAKRTCILLSLIRSGETTWLAENRLQGTSDLPLSEAGRAAVTADASGPVPRLGVISHPPDEAASETARIFARACGCRTKEIADLADPHLGLLEGLAEQVFAERYPKRYKRWQGDPLTLSAPEGEDLVEARARLFAAVARILRRSRNDAVAVVLHPLNLGFMRCWLADRPTRDLKQLLADRPRIERYALTPPMIQWLEEAATAVPSRA